jgi:hypothetical protein
MSAEQVLERIGELPAQGFDESHVRPALANLSLREILRATRQRYDTAPLGQADQMLVALLDVNGRALATAGLANLARSGGRAPEGTSLGEAARRAADALARQRVTARPSTGTRTPDVTGAEPAQDAANQSGASPGGAPQARQHAGGAGGADSGRARVLVLFALLATLIVPIVRRMRPA